MWLRVVAPRRERWPFRITWFLASIGHKMGSENPLRFSPSANHSACFPGEPCSPRVVPAAKPSAGNDAPAGAPAASHGGIVATSRHRGDHHLQLVCCCLLQVTMNIITIHRLSIIHDNDKTYHPQVINYSIIIDAAARGWDWFSEVRLAVDGAEPRFSQSHVRARLSSKQKGAHGAAILREPGSGRRCGSRLRVWQPPQLRGDHILFNQYKCRLSLRKRCRSSGFWGPGAAAYT